jgi:hypothetical protein
MSKKISAISIFALRIEQFRNNLKIGTGTGFIYFYEKLGKHFLVTNYHVLTCRDPKNPAMLLRDYPDSPDEIRWSTLSKETFEISVGRVRLSDVTLVEHPRRSDGIDIAAIMIDLPSDVLFVTEKDLGLVTDINFEVASDLFIVGFPFGISTADMFPLWKRGTVASEPLIKPLGISQFYIDATTAPGMSGSPVFASEDRQVVDVSAAEALAMATLKDGVGSAVELLAALNPDSFKNPYLKKHFQFVGIYSGRMSAKEKNSSIGIVWGAELITEMFDDPIFVPLPVTL